MTQRIAILIFDGVEELDAVGPWEVLSYWTRTFPEDGYHVELVAASDDIVTAAKGMRFIPDAVRNGNSSYDVFVHPGGIGTRTLMNDDDHLDWMRELRSTTPIMASVCTGSLVYASAGLLTDRPATTHWASIDTLINTDPSVDVQPDARWVDDGDIVTSAGISAGIDMSLHLVHRVAGFERARQVRRGIQYDPAPPV